MIKTFPPVAELLPHAGRAILVDELRTETAHGVVAAARIRRTHPWFSAELCGVPNWVGIELMAQTIALHAGLVARRAHDRPRVGYLLGTRRYTAAVPSFAEGAELEIRVERLYLDDSGLGAYDCAITNDGARLASATLTVFQAKQEVQP